MKQLKRLQIIIGVLLWFLVFGLYAASAARTMTGFGDSDELVAAGYTLSIPHPPGYPLLTGLLFLFTHMPGISPGLGANLLAAAIMASVMVMIYTVSLAFGRQKKKFPSPFQVIAVGVVTLAVATTGLLWEHGTYIEALGLNAFFSLFLLWLTVKLVGTDKKMRDEPILIVGWSAVAGLGMAHHQTFVFALLPMGVFLVTSLMKQKPMVWRQLLLLPVVSAFFFGLSYGLLWWLGNRQSPLSWQFTASLEGLWRFYKRADYSGYSTESGILNAWWSGFSVDKTVEAWNFYVAEMWRHWGILVILGLIGLLTARKRLKGWYVPLLAVWVLAGPLLSGYVTLADATFGSIDFETNRAITERMYVLGETWWGIWTVLGGVWIAEFLKKEITERKIQWGMKGLLGVAIALLIAVTVYRFPRYDLSDYRAVENYMSDILVSLPTGSRLICLSDISCFGATYAQTILNIRPDVVVISSAPQYHFEALKNDATLARFRYPDNPFRIGETIGWSTGHQQPIYVTQLNDYWSRELGLNTEAFWLTPTGYTFEITRVPPRSQTTPGFTYTPIQTLSEELAMHHRFITVFRSVLGEQHAINAHLYSRMGFYEPAMEELNRGLIRNPGSTVLEQMRQTLPKSPPDPRFQMVVNEESYLAASQECRKNGNIACDLRNSQWAVWRRPDHVVSRLNLAQALEFAGVEPLAKREYMHVLELDGSNTEAMSGLKRLENVRELGERLE